MDKIIAVTVFLIGGKGSRNFKRSLRYIWELKKALRSATGWFLTNEQTKSVAESVIFAPTACITGRNAKITPYFALRTG
jgi:hypothetical protein